MNNSSAISHNILDLYVDLNIFLKVLFVWLSNYYKYLILKSQNKNDYIFKNHIINKLFIDSFIGVWSIKNLYFFYLFEKFFNIKKNHKIITYVSEFQSWEKLLFYNSNSRLSKNIFAIKFSPHRNWDLKYVFQITKNNINLYPKKIITFYNSSRKNLTKIFSKFKKIQIIVAENLRPLDFSFKKKFKNKKILIVGDHDDNSTLNLLDVINNFLEYKSIYSFDYKPHPISKVRISQFDKLQNIKVFDDNKCFEYIYDAYIVSNKTTLGLELLNKGFKTGVILDSKSLNLSPLDKGYQFFIKNEKELKNFINLKKSYNSSLFKINKTISWNNIATKWSKLLYYD